MSPLDWRRARPFAGVSPAQVPWVPSRVPAEETSSTRFSAGEAAPVIGQEDGVPAAKPLVTKTLLFAGLIATSVGATPEAPLRSVVSKAPCGVGTLDGRVNFCTLKLAVVSTV